MKRVLLIDDDERFRLLLKRLLLRNYDFRIFEAPDGEIGLELFEKEKPHIIFLDLDMPRCNGHQFLEKVNPLSINTAIIVLTNSDDKECVRNILNYGVADYIIKSNLVVLFKERLEAAIKKINRTTVITV